MTFDHQDLQAVLAHWPRTNAPKDGLADGLSERIRQILCISADHPGSSTLRGDFPPLVRQHLLRESSRTGRRAQLRVPRDEYWPSAVEWEQCGVSALAISDRSFLLTAEAWHPSWLGDDSRGVFADAFSERVVRREGRCTADPFVADVTGYGEYACPGQREAIRAAFLLRRGHTLLVNLPTGSGKSLVGQVPALVNRDHGHLTLFVVPTVALALDQARQMGIYLRHQDSVGRSWPLAWYGGMPSEERSEIVVRLRSGTQRILFTSPEALTTSLLQVIFDIAAAGMLNYLVIDEAHLLTQWGDDFRPAFQALAGLRNALLRMPGEASLRTLLLSATFTKDTVETLATLFGPPERVHMVSAVHLRPEPQYWFYCAQNPSEKIDCVLDAIRHAPRPFILYLTRQRDAKEWYRILRNQLSLERIACFHGSTPDQDRKLILDRWVRNELDGIVATSAFGVGIDKSDVHTVIHATIPETLDRFYQEVGRGGRSGRSSISLLIHDGTDWSLPERLGKRKIISDELGFNRWKSLYGSGSADHEGLLSIDIDAVPEHGTGSSEYNVSWNMKTLLLMARAGLIALDVQAKRASSVESEIPEYSPSSPLAAMASIRVRILNDGHLLPSVWEQHIGPCRASTYEAQEWNLRLMKELLRNEREVGQVLGELYRSSSKSWPVHVTEVCGGCPKDRFLEDRRTMYRLPVPAPLFDVASNEMTSWKKHFPWLDPGFLLVFFDDSSSKKRVHSAIMDFLAWLVSECGLQEVAINADSEMASLPQYRTLYRKSPSGIVIHRTGETAEPYSPLLRVTVFDRPASPKDLWDVRMLQRPHHIVLLPKTTIDPENELRLLVDTSPNSADLDQLLSVLIQ